MKISIVFVTVLLNLLVFQFLNLGQFSSTSTGGGSKIMGIEKSNFTAHVTVPQKLKTNKEFTIKVDFQVKAEQKLTIMSREKMFVFLIKDRNGKQINSYGVKDGGHVRMFSGKETISEVYKYKIKEPGIYVISAVTEFKVNKDGSIEDYKIETDPQTVEVTE